MNERTKQTSQEQQDFNKKSKDNAEAIKSEIGSLASGHWAGLGQRDCRSFFTHAKEISNMFRTLKPLRREDREPLWQRFDGLCEELKSRQNSANNDRRHKSEDHRRDILNKVENSRPQSLFGFLPPDVQDMKGLGQVLKEAGRWLSEYKGEMFGEHKQECFTAIQDMRHVHDIWWDELKSHRAQGHEDYLQRQGDRRERARANLEKLHDMHQHTADALGRARAHADELRDQIASAWSDEFRDRASGWLSEEEDRISDMEAHLERIEGWIREAEERLG